MQSLPAAIRHCGLTRKDGRAFHPRCNGLPVTRHCAGGPQPIPGILRAQEMENAFPDFSQTIFILNLRTPGGNANHKDSLRGSAYVIDTMESLGAVFRKTRAARNMLQQTADTHGKSEWENVTVTSGLKSTASPAKAAVHRYLPDFAASIATRVALPQITNCKITA